LSILLACHLEPSIIDLLLLERDGAWRIYQSLLKGEEMRTQSILVLAMVFLVCISIQTSFATVASFQGLGDLSPMTGEVQKEVK
jgi:hypothetical protein